MEKDLTRNKAKNLKLSHFTPRRRLRERKYTSYSFSTLALDGVKWSASRTGRDLDPGKGPPEPTVHESGWAPEPVWTKMRDKNPLPLPEIEPRPPGCPARSQTLY
jgi:hypothetical protein